MVLVAERQPALDPASPFTLGLFSVIEALLDAPITEILTSIPFPEPMARALTDHDGLLGEILATVIAIEDGALVDVRPELADAPTVYLEAVEWADAVAATLSKGWRLRADHRSLPPDVSR